MVVAAVEEADMLPREVLEMVVQMEVTAETEEITHMVVAPGRGLPHENLESRLVNYMEEAAVVQAFMERLEEYTMMLPVGLAENPAEGMEADAILSESQSPIQEAELAEALDKLEQAVL